MEEAPRKLGIWTRVDEEVRPGHEEFSVHHNGFGVQLRFLLFVAAHDSSPSHSIPIRQFPDQFRRFTCSTPLIDTPPSIYRSRPKNVWIGSVTCRTDLRCFLAWVQFCFYLVPSASFSYRTSTQVVNQFDKNGIVSSKYKSKESCYRTSCHVLKLIADT
jgi:hypothetical protein